MGRQANCDTVTAGRAKLLLFSLMNHPMVDASCVAHYLHLLLKVRNDEGHQALNFFMLSE